MAVAAVNVVQSELAAYARDARLARVLAVLLDTVIVVVLTLVVNGVYGVAQITSGSPIPNSGGFAIYSWNTVVPWPWLTLLGIVYFTVPEALFGATPGKYLTGLRVICVAGRPLNLGAVVIRNLLKPIDWLPLFYLLGGASVLLTTNSQRLGDLAAGTTVVYRHRALNPGATRSSSPRARRNVGVALLVAILVTIGFDYFGRPPLVIEGVYNRHAFAVAGVTSYSLGSAQWGFGSVTYPLTTRGATSAADCTGTFTLHWNLFGWQDDSSSLSCAS